MTKLPDGAGARRPTRPYGDSQAEEDRHFHGLIMLKKEGGGGDKRGRMILHPREEGEGPRSDGGGGVRKINSSS